MEVICFQNKEKYSDVKNLECDLHIQGRNVKRTNKMDKLSQLPEINNTVANTVSCNLSLKIIPQTFSNIKLKAEQCTIWVQVG